METPLARAFRAFRGHAQDDFVALLAPDAEARVHPCIEIPIIARSARLFLSLGVRTLRLTGGEPLLRKDLERLVRERGTTTRVLHRPAVA